MRKSYAVALISVFLAVLPSHAVFSATGSLSVYSPADISRADFVQTTQQIAGDYRSYLDSLVSGQCPSVLKQGKKGLLVTFKSKANSSLSHVAIFCKSDGSATAVSADEAIQRASETLPGPCGPETTSDFGPVLSQALQASQVAAKAAQGCDAGEGALGVKLVKGCLEGMMEDFQKMQDFEESPYVEALNSVKNDVKGIRGSPAAPQKVGCLWNFYRAFLDNIASTGKLVLSVLKSTLSLPQKTSQILRQLHQKSNQTSDSSLLASSQSESMIQSLLHLSSDAISTWHLFKSFISRMAIGITGMIKNELGCQKWSGQPFQSQCVAPMNDSCTSCGQLGVLSCGIAGLGSSELLMNYVFGLGIGASVETGTETVAPQLEKLASSQVVKNMIDSSQATRGGALAVGRAVSDFSDVWPLSYVKGQMSAILSQIKLSFLDQLASQIPLEPTLRKSFEAGATVGRRAVGALGSGVAGASEETAESLPEGVFGGQLVFRNEARANAVDEYQQKYHINPNSSFYPISVEVF